jgi:hypothetical protein
MQFAFIEIEYSKSCTRTFSRCVDLVFWVVVRDDFDQRRPIVSRSNNLIDEIHPLTMAPKHLAFHIATGTKFGTRRCRLTHPGRRGAGVRGNRSVTVETNLPL